ncbi:MAG TPA: tRNA (adenosine(37)-N6)-dimethylallyltransferase MiaA [Alphaproteobacteria bacterium]|nr:tRNA (adenosine(37)-N6)-dimethylallyltransferase MiaA [Alphaproteobacteria bacterium]
MQKNKAILLFGPTASGKTALAIELAKKFNGEIINADSRQFYKNMPIITAMPSDEEFSAVPHHLFECLETDSEFSVAEYLKLAKQVCDDVAVRGRLPIFVGGTGLYLKMLEFGLSSIPNINKDLFNDLNSMETEDLYSQLNSIDEAMSAKLESNDRQRIIRALGVIKQTGKSLLDWQELPNEGMLDLDFIHLAINPDREVMYNRINSRASKMLELGLIDEVKVVIEKYGQERLNSLTSIGFDIFLDAFNAKLEMNEAIDKFAQKQRNYAKRQITWLKHQYPFELIHEDLDVTFKFVEEKLG